MTKPWVKFSEPVDPTTVTSSTFSMMKQGAAVKVPAGFEYGPSPNVVKLLPVAPLEGGAVYEVTVTVGVRDLDGEALSTPWSWTFRVVPDEPVDVFVDVPPGSTYYAAIQGLYEAGIVDGSDGPMGPEFHPAKWTTSPAGGGCQWAGAARPRAEALRQCQELKRAMSPSSPTTVATPPSNPISYSWAVIGVTTRA
ncbi:MAG: Ig-like domain-containing protein [Thermoleophilia bacterium]